LEEDAAPDLTCDLWCCRTSFVASEQLGESGRIALQKASYFAEGSHAQLDGLSNESNADRGEIPSSGKRTQSLEADMVLLTDSLAELFKCQPATRLESLGTGLELLDVCRIVLHACPPGQTQARRSDRRGA
jgi:hypothetical protein